MLSAGCVRNNEQMVNSNNVPATSTTTLEEIIEKNEDPTLHWLSYEDQDVGFLLKFPPTMSVKSSLNTAIFIDVVGDPLLAIRFRDGSVSSWQEQTPKEKIEFAGQSGQKYEYQYCAIPGCNFPAIAYVIPYQGKILAVEFIGDTELDETEKLIIQHFMLTK